MQELPSQSISSGSWAVTGTETTSVHYSVVFFSYFQRQKTYTCNSPLLTWLSGIPRLRQTLQRKILGVKMDRTLDSFLKVLEASQAPCWP